MNTLKRQIYYNKFCNVLLNTVINMECSYLFDDYYCSKILLSIKNNKNKKYK